MERIRRAVEGSGEGLGRDLRRFGTVRSVASGRRDLRMVCAVSFFRYIRSFGIVRLRSLRHGREGRGGGSFLHDGSRDSGRVRRGRMLKFRWSLSRRRGRRNLILSNRSSVRRILSRLRVRSIVNCIVIQFSRIRLRRIALDGGSSCVLPRVAMRRIVRIGIGEGRAMRIRLVRRGGSIRKWFRQSRSSRFFSIGVG